MYDIDFLESQWKKYNKKKRRPYYVGSLFLLTIVGLGLLFVMNKALILKKLESLQTKEVSLKHESVFKDSPIDTLALKKDKLESGFKKMPSSSVVIDTNPMEPEDVLIETEEKPNTTVTSKRENSDRRVRPKMHLEIVEMSGEQAYKDVKNRFSIAPDPDDSLFLARNYYKDKKYTKAAYWALQTNKLNGEIEESWLIFAHAKAKTGHKNEAIRVLSEYVNRSNSLEARKLLQKLKR